MKRTLSFILFSMLVMAGTSFGFGGADQDCMKCHKLSNDDAKEALKDIIPDLKVIDVRPAASKGMWEVALESGGKKGLVYLDIAKKHLISGSVISIKERRNFTQERFDDLNRIDFSKIPLENALVMGSTDAKNKIVVFDDPD